LTVNEVEDAGEATRFTVNLIPHTADHTTLGGIAEGRKLNLEIDVLARYLKRMTDARETR
jgi:riboflavin synthase